MEKVKKIMMIFVIGVLFIMINVGISSADEKEDMTKVLIKLSGELIDLYYKMSKASEIWSDNEYQSGGSKEITQGDIDAMSLGVTVTAAQIANVITTINNLKKFMTNEDPTNADYLNYLNSVRSKSW